MTTKTSPTSPAININPALCTRTISNCRVLYTATKSDLGLKSIPAAVIIQGNALWYQDAIRSGDEISFWHFSNGVTNFVLFNR